MAPAYEADARSNRFHPRQRPAQTTRDQGGTINRRPQRILNNPFGYFGGTDYAFGLLETTGARITPETYQRYQSAAPGTFRVNWSDGGFKIIVIGPNGSVPLYTDLLPTDQAYVRHDQASAQFFFDYGENWLQNPQARGVYTGLQLQHGGEIVRTPIMPAPDYSLRNGTPAQQAEWARQIGIHLADMRFKRAVALIYYGGLGAIILGTTPRLLRMSNSGDVVDVLGNPSALAQLDADIAQAESELAEYVGRVGTDARLYDIGSNVGAIFGSSLGTYLTEGNPFLETVSGSFLATIGQNLGQAIAVGGLSRPVVLTGPGNSVEFIADSVLDDFGQEFLANLKSAAIGTVSSLITMELGSALGLQGFGAELFGAVGSSVVGSAISNISNFGVNNVWNGFQVDNLFRTNLSVYNADGTIKLGTDGQPLTQSGVGVATVQTVSAFFGARLGAMVVQPQTQAATLLSSVGSSIGTWAFTSASVGISSAVIGTAVGNAAWLLGNVVLPGVGAFVGFVLGALVGNLFGRMKPRIPTAFAETTLQIPLARYELGASGSQNGGNLDLAKVMATTARDTLNGLIDELVGGGQIGRVANLTGSTTNQIYGHAQNPQNGLNQTYVTLDGQRTFFNSPDQAVESGVLGAIRATQVIGGDLYLKRALARTNAKDLTSLMGDLQIAGDYEKYMTETSEINKLISANPTSSFSAAWTATLYRASELKLDKFAASDFYGGLRGFSDSFELSKHNLGYENIEFVWEGHNVRVDAHPTGPEGVFSMMPTSFDAGRSMRIDNFFGSNLGYVGWVPWELHQNNYIDERSAGHSINLMDVNNPGDDIAVTGSGADQLRGGDGWDWLDAKGGDDKLWGDAGNDVLLGKGGRDQLFGGSGEDYLAGGAGEDLFEFGAGLYGEGGNDTLVGGADRDNMSGGDGNDTFLVEQDGGAIRDTHNGDAGSDTASFERWTQGISFDMRAGLFQDGWFHSYGDAYNVENITGTKFNDIIIGQDYDGAIPGSNVLKGLAGDDRIEGGTNDDTLEGGAGADRLVGGGHWDTLSYLGSSAGVYVNLKTNEAFGGDAEGDTWIEMEHVQGSRFADELTGAGWHTQLYGEGGDDWFNWSGGNADWFWGGEGFDTVDYSTANVAVQVYLDRGWNLQSGGAAGTEGNFNSIEGLIGTNYNDTFRGTVADEWFEGGLGNDTMTGGDGSDAYVFGRGGGADLIVDTKDKHNTLLLGEGITFTDLVLTHNGPQQDRAYSHLYVQIGGTNDRVTIQDNFATWDNTVIKVLDLNGSAQLDLSTARYLSAGTAGNDVRGGYKDRTELFVSYAGDDTFDGRGGATPGAAGDVLIGGLGNDTFRTGDGDDQFAFERGHGRDNIDDWGGEDTIVFGPTVAAEDVIYEVVGLDLYVGARDLNTPDLKASQVADHIRVINGAPTIDIYHDEWGSERDRIERPVKLEYVIAGGASIDLRKLDIPGATRNHYDPPGGGHIPPIVFDLNNDGVTITNVANSDIVARNSSGGIVRLSWAGPEDGFLAVDRDGDGAINKVSEIRFTQDKKGAKTDLEGLSAWDSNADGKLDSTDKDWGKLLIWVDANQNGRSTKKELRSLTDAGISFVDLKGRPTGRTAELTDQSFVHNEITFGRKDGTKGTAYDMAIAQRWLHSFDTETGKYVKAFGKEGDDYELGTLLNDPRAESKAEKEKKDGKEHKRGDPLDYDDVAKRAKLDFSDHDNVKATKPKSEDALVETPDVAIDYSDPEAFAKLSGMTAAERQADPRGEGMQRVLPLVFDLDGDGAELIDAKESQVQHDVDGDGRKEKIGWVGSDDAILALDRNSDGAIQLTSEISFVGDTPGAKTDLEGLAAFDENGDGVLSAADSAFARFVLWRDLNGNGVSEAGELTGLAEAGFTELALAARGRHIDNGQVESNQILGRTVARRDAQAGLGQAPALGSPSENPAQAPMPAEVEAASIPGEGTSIVADLRVAIGRLLGAKLGVERVGGDAKATGSIGTAAQGATARWAGRDDPDKADQEAEAASSGWSDHPRNRAHAALKNFVGGRTSDRLASRLSEAPITEPAEAIQLEQPRPIGNHMGFGDVMAEFPSALDEGGSLGDLSTETPIEPDPSLAMPPTAARGAVDVYDVAFGVAPLDENAPPAAESEVVAQEEGAAASSGGFGNATSAWDRFGSKRSDPLSTATEEFVEQLRRTKSEGVEGSDVMDPVESARLTLKHADEGKTDVRRRVAAFTQGRGSGSGWWREGLDSSDTPVGDRRRLAQRLHGAEAAPSESSAWAHAQQQAQLLRQGLAAFKGGEGASAAIWRRAGERPIEETLSIAQASIRNHAAKSIVDLA